MDWINCIFIAYAYKYCVCNFAAEKCTDYTTRNKQNTRDY